MSKARKQIKKSGAVNLRRWVSYAAAGAAAVAAANEAEATVYYSGVLNTVLNHSGTANISFPTSIRVNPLSHAQSANSYLFALSQVNYPNNKALDYVFDYAGFGAGQTSLKVAGFKSAAAAYHSTSFFASRLAAGVKIGTQHFVSSASLLLAAGSQANPYKFAGTGTVGFLAFETTLSGTEYYGWAQVKNIGNSNGRGGNAPYVNDIELIDYAYSDDPNFITGQGEAVPTPAWTGATNTSWAVTTNWSTGVIPGATSGTTDTDTALFNQNPTNSNSPLNIDSGRNLQNITFDSGGGLLTTSLTVGTAGGNPLLLTSGGVIQTTSSVANPQYVNAPLVLEGNYAFTSGATIASATLSFGGGITSGAASGTTTLTLNGANSGTNTLSGVLADGIAGSKLAVLVNGTGVWVFNGATSTYSGGTTIASGATLELAGSVSALGSAQNISNAGSLVVAGGNQTVGTVLGTGSVAVNNGSLTAYQIRQNSLTIGNGATVALVPSGSGSTTQPASPNNINYSSSLTSLSIAGGMDNWKGTLDIGNNGLVIAYGTPANDPYTTINNMVESGYNGGVWGGTGITSSLAQAGVTLHIATPLNIGLLDFTPGTGNYSNTTFIVFEGQTVTTNAILVRLTYMDDLVLAGDMQSNNATSDALLFAANYGTGTTWGVGDLVHDGGPINSSDALLFAANYVVGLPSLDGSSGGDVALGSGAAAVPEPASVGLLAFGGAGLLEMRRRQRANRPAAK